MRGGGIYFNENIDGEPYIKRWRYFMAAGADY